MGAGPSDHTFEPGDPHELLSKIPFGGELGERDVAALCTPRLEHRVGFHLRHRAFRIRQEAIQRHRCEWIAYGDHLTFKHADAGRLNEVGAFAQIAISRRTCAMSMSGYLYQWCGSFQAAVKIWRVFSKTAATSYVKRKKAQ